MVQREKEYQSDHQPAVTLYLDDVEEIVQVLSNRFTLSDGEYQFDSLEEFIAKRGTRPRDLRFRSKNGTVLRLRTWSPFGVYLSPGYGGEGELELLRLREILRRRQRGIVSFFPPRVWWAIVLLAWLGLIAQSLRALPATGISLLARAVLIILPVAVLGTMVRSGLGTTINLSRRHETSTFLSRNGEKLISASIGALVGAAGKSFFDWLSK